MAGPGFAFQVVGAHGKTAAPKDFEESVWQNERMPTFADLEIEGRGNAGDEPVHAQFDDPLPAERVPTDGTG